MSFPAQVKYIALSVLFVLATINLSKTTLQVLNSSQRLDNLHGEISDLEAKKAYLASDLAYKKSPEYVEEAARTQLNMVKQGERVYVVPAVLGHATSGGGEGKDAFSRDMYRKESSNIEAWLALLF